MATARLRVARAARRTSEIPRILCASGPNLQLLGTREPDIYGKETLVQIHERLIARARELGVNIDCRQTNHEGTICDWIAEARDGFDAILLNAGAYTHTSLALYDAIKAVAVPCVEVHLSNPDAREAFRRESRIAPACVARIAGFGSNSYVLALEGIVTLLARS
jgi:3-dehydroquinate dehydratase-2